MNLRQKSLTLIGVTFGGLILLYYLMARVILSGTLAEPLSRYLAASILVAGLIFAALSLLALEKKVFSQLGRLSGQESPDETNLLVLCESERRHKEIVENLDEGYYEMDLAGNITFCNQAAACLFGYTGGDLTGRNYHELFSDPDQAYLNFRRVFLYGRSAREVVLKAAHREDTPETYLELSISLLKDQREVVTGFRGVVRDVTERRRFEEQLKYLSLHDSLTGLYNRAYFEEELRKLQRSRDFPVTVITVDVDGLKLINDTFGHSQGDALLKQCARLLKEPLREADVCARIGGDEFAVILPRTGTAAAAGICNRLRQTIDRYNSNSSQIPIYISMGMATGTGAQYPLMETFKEADDNMYREKLFRSTWVHRQFIDAQIASLDQRDYLIDGHGARLQEMCLKMSRRLDLSQRQATDLAILATAHDLGKVAIPEQILFKAGPLTEQEREIVRRHPEKGYHLARYSEDLTRIADLILRHHEHWDGGGYPLGLKGEAIPVECRLLAITDAYDVMTHERSYAAARSPEEALAEIRRCAGRQFDPHLVELFLEIMTAP